MQAWPIILVVGIFAAFISHLRRVREEHLKLLADGKNKSDFSPYATVKIIVRPDGKERVRIFQRPDNTYGVAIDYWSNDGEFWFPPTSAGTGAYYASVEIAESEIPFIAHWCHANEKTDKA